MCTTISTTKQPIIRDYNTMTTIQPQRAVDLIIEQLRADILEGIYPIGSCLPAERKLSEQLQVNRLTLRAAISHLQAEGFVAPKQGQGIMVLNYKDTANIDILQFLHDSESLAEVLPDLLSLRQLLAAEAVAGASIHATINDVNRLKSIMENQQKTEDSQEFIENDFRFFQILIQASNNLVLRLLFNSINKITKNRPEITNQLLRNKKQTIGSYQALIQLIKCRRPDLAKKAILGYATNEEHLEIQKALQSNL